MEMYGYSFQREEDLMHHGIKGMKWGIRRYQNEDGSLTSTGKVRYAKKEWKNASKEFNKSQRKNNFGMRMVQDRKNKEEKAKKVNDAYDAYMEAKVDRARERKGERGERREYVRQMYKSGLPGSYSDAQSGGASSRMYDRMVSKKGQAYADSVAKSVRNRAVGAIAGSTALAVGMAFVSANM